MPPNTLQVIPNPYKMLDADGNPIAVFPCHPRHAPREFVGAKMTIVVEMPAEMINIKRKDRRGTEHMETVEARTERSRARFEFTTQPVDLPASGAMGAYYRAGIRDGVLLPANEATARACNMPFVPVAEALRKESEQAANTYQREHGVLPVWAQPVTLTPAPVAAP